MRTLAEYNDYFKQISLNNKAIKGFYRISMSREPFDLLVFLSEFTDALRNLELPCLIAVAYDSNFIDNNSDNVLQLTQGNLMLLDEGGGINAYDANFAAMDRMEAIGKQIIAYMKKDVQLNRLRWGDVQLQDFSCTRIGPVEDNLFGVNLQFSYLYGVNAELKYNANHAQYWDIPLSL